MKIALMFSGQGSQFPGMMKDLYQSEPATKAVFDAADAALGRIIHPLLRRRRRILNLTHNTQPSCVLAADLAAAAALRAHGVEAQGLGGVLARRVRSAGLGRGDPHGGRV